MVIPKKPVRKQPLTAEQKELAEQEVLGRAPDGKKPKRAPTRELPADFQHKKVISLTIHPDILKLADEQAKLRGVSRASLLALGVLELAKESVDLKDATAGLKRK